MYGYLSDSLCNKLLIFHFYEICNLFILLMCSKVDEAIQMWLGFGQMCALYV